MTSESLAQGQLLAHIVNRGIDRAYAAAEAVARDYHDVTITVYLPELDNLLSVRDPELSVGKFVLNGAGFAHDLDFCLEQTQCDMESDLRREIAELTKEDLCPPECKLLPAWFSRRMMTDTWSFGVLLATGQVLAVESIIDITRDAAGEIWLDFCMMKRRESTNTGSSFGELTFSPTSRTTVSINARQVVAAFELADS